MNPKFFTVEEAGNLIGFLDNALERVKRDRQRYLWLQEEISVLKLIVECGAEDNNGDAVALRDKTKEFKRVEREIEKGKAAINETGCIIRDEEKGLRSIYSPKTQLFRQMDT